MTFQIDYESEGFPTGASVANGAATLTANWNDLLAAAITVGRPNWRYVFRHGRSSIYEAIFRWSLVRMALEQTGSWRTRLRRTDAARTLDPSEKGAVNYFLGLAVCKLFATKLLNTPWLLHLDVFRPALNPVLAGRSRPDLVGQTVNGGWIALECKGRLSAPNAKVKNDAKVQAQRLVSVNGTAPTCYIGAVAYFHYDVLNFLWRDPQSSPNPKNPIKVEVKPKDWRHYYAPTLDLLQANPDYLERMKEDSVLMPVEDADVEIGILPNVLRALLHEDWDAARTIAETSFTKDPNGLYQPDGIAVVAGESWSQKFTEFFE